jgi:hypothetical protein
MTGTVTHIAADGAIGAAMDQYIEGAEHWNNEHWWYAGEAELLAQTAPLPQKSLA